jgi:hypothetical protein
MQRVLNGSAAAFNGSESGPRSANGSTKTACTSQLKPRPDLPLSAHPGGELHQRPPDRGETVLASGG